VSRIDRPQRKATGRRRRLLHTFIARNALLAASSSSRSPQSRRNAFSSSSVGRGRSVVVMAIGKPAESQVREKRTGTSTNQSAGEEMNSEGSLSGL
jgi:hypothetical protein